MEEIKNRSKEAAKRTASRTREAAKTHAGGFTTFIREQGVVGLAVGFILGGAVAKLVTSLVTDIINPLIGVLLGKTGNLKTAVWSIGSAKIAIGSFVSTLIDFAIVALVVYFGVKLLKLDKLDVKSEKPLVATKK